jgi:hypothetical protein
MSINFIPNDPRAGSAAPGMRVQAKRPNRPITKSGFAFTNVSAEGTFLPGTPQFLFWQCREAALAAVQAWEASAGAHRRWQGNRKKVPVLQDAGVDLNAFYDRATFSFFHRTVSNITFFSGASTDVVAHEVGHGLLDSVRPDFFDVNFLEVGAFHEAFGDCMAMLTALNDTETRQKLLALTSTLRKRNFVETTAEDLSVAIGLLLPNHNAAKARHAFNTFQYQLPQTLPDDGGPGVLINEVHSFGMIFTGCFWDLIANLFGAMASKTEASLLSAARGAGKILIAGAREAIIRPRFFQSVGRSMVLVDETLNGGANRNSIRDAFQRHNILLGADALLAPSMALAGSAPSKAALLGAATRKDLLSRLGLRRGQRLSLKRASLFGTPVVTATHTAEVPLGGVHKSLKGVVAMAQVPIMVGASGAKAAIVGNLPNPVDTEGEVQAFAKQLVEHDRIDFGRAKAGARETRPPDGITHEVKSVGGKKVLRRIRFQCQICA